MTEEQRLEHYIWDNLQRWRGIARSVKEPAYALMQAEKFQKQLNRIKAGDLEIGEAEAVLKWFEHPGKVTETAVEACQLMVKLFENKGDIDPGVLEQAMKTARTAVELWEQLHESETVGEVRSEPHDPDVLFLWGTEERDHSDGSRGT